MYICVADVCCCRCHTLGPDKLWPNKHNTSNMRAVDKHIVHTLNTDHTWLLPSPNRASFTQHYLWVCASARIIVCVCLSIRLVAVLSPVTPSQDKQALCYRLLFNKGLFCYYHIIISLSVSICVCFYLSSTCLSACLFFCFSLPLSLLLLLLSLILEISAISADCHIVCVCLLACLFRYGFKVRQVPEEVKWVLLPSVSNQLMDRVACLCWWRPQLPC